MPSTPKIAVASNTFSNNEVLRKALLDHFPNAYFNMTGRILAGVELVEFLRNGTAAIMGLEKIDAVLFDACPQLRVISKFGVGLDNVDLAGAAQRNIKVLSTPGVNAYAVAELSLGLMLSVARRIAIGTHHLKNGQWVKHGGVQVFGKKVGLIGLGHVGKQTADVLQSVGCKVMAYDVLDLRGYCKSKAIQFASLDEVLAENDFVSLHVPLTPKTRGMIGSEQLKKMQPTSFLINTARGLIVDEKALAQALAKNTIAGAAFDVFAEEPGANAELLRCENFIATAHIGGNSSEAIHAVGMAAVTNLLTHFGTQRTAA